MRTFPPHGAVHAIAWAAAILLCATALSPYREPLPLTVRYPAEGAHIGAVASSFTFGSTAAGAVVSVNGKPASVAPDGGWIAYVPFSPGNFVLHVRARLGGASAQVDRQVWVDDGSMPAYPSELTIVQPGDAVALADTAQAGASVTASGPGFSHIALATRPGGDAHTYLATIRASRHAAGPAHVVYFIMPPRRGETETVSRATLEVASRTVLFVGDVVPYAPDPESGARPYGMLSPTAEADTEYTVPLGTQVAVTARVGNQLRIGIGGAQPEWIDRREVAADPRAVLPLAATVRAVTRSENATGTTVDVRLSGARVPFRVYESPTGGSGAIRFFGAPTADRSVVVRFALRQHAFWGYFSRWSANDLVVTFRKPPAFVSPPVPALHGLKVVVDPGHAPDTGAIGPVGTIERDVNLDIALRLATKLRALGATVVMTRNANTGIALYDRPALAESLDADVLISVHNNAPPDGVDPTLFRGYSVYYFQPHSRALARAIHDAYGRDTGLRDAGLHTGDLALVRTSQLPAVLTESAFVTWPWEEMQLRDPAFRDRLAATIADGMERWAEKMRSIERGG